MAPSGLDISHAQAAALPAADWRDRVGVGGRSSWVVSGLVGLLVATVSAIAFRDPLVNGDTIWALVWGEQLLHGQLETFRPGPTPHPLPIAFGALTELLGSDGSYVATYLIFGPLSLGLLAAGVFDVARRVSGTSWAAGLAVVLVASSPVILAWAAPARYDVLFAALVLGAIGARVARAHDSLLSLSLLAVAGLIRPEAWGLAGILWLWQVRRLDVRRRIAGAAFVAAAPVTWMLMDVLVMGDPLYSLTMTDAASETLYGRFTRGENLAEGGRNLYAIVGVFVLVCFLPGVVRVARRRDVAGSATLGTLAVTAGVFVALVANGMASSERYLLLPACLICIVAATAAVPRRGRSVAPVLLTAALLVQVLVRLDAPFEVRANYAATTDRMDDIAEVVARPGVGHALRTCPAVGVPTVRMVGGFVRRTGRPGALWTETPRGTRPVDVYVAPASESAIQDVMARRRFDADTSFTVPAGLRPGPRTAHWQVHYAPASPCTRALTRSAS